MTAAEDCMRRRGFVAAALAALACPAAAQAQNTAPDLSSNAPGPIEPQNALERTFVQALTNAEMRPAFRRQLLESQVALAMTGGDADAAPREFPYRGGATTAAVFTSAARLSAVLGDDAPRIVVSGRAALELLRGKNVVINPTLAPMLTLEPEDVERWLETPQ
jgi:hypothetical protein